MKRSAYLFLLALLFLARLCPADSAATNGNIVINFPTSSWFQTAPPDLVRKSFERNPNVKLVFHAVSSPAKLQLFATRCDYSSFNASTDRALGSELAAYLGGVKLGFSKYTNSGIVERFDNLARIPTQTIDVKLTNHTFLEIRTYFCSTCLYSFEITGPTGSHEEADNCLAGVSLVNEQPLNSAIFASALKNLGQGGLTLLAPKSTITNGDLIINFPTDSWIQSEAPEAMLQAFARNRNVKFLFHAVSRDSKLRFYITRCDYSAFPHTTDHQLSLELAAYLNGLRQGRDKTTGAADIETFDELAPFPFAKIQGTLSNGMSLEIKTVFCSDCLYSLQVSGPPTSHDEAEQCLSGVTLIGKTPLPSAILGDALQLRGPARAKTAAYEMGRKIGVISVFVIFGAVALAIIISATQAHKTAKRPPPPIPVRRTMPPPPPPPTSALPPPPPSDPSPLDPPPTG